MLVPRFWCRCELPSIATPAIPEDTPLPSMQFPWVPPRGQR
jgi:hypothetical protein